MSDQEKFNPDLMNVDGYAEKFPLEPVVVEMDLETVKVQKDKIQLSPDLSLESLGRVPGLCVYKDTKLVSRLNGLSLADLKLIREYLDNPQAANDLIPKE